MFISASYNTLTRYKSSVKQKTKDFFKLLTNLRMQWGIADKKDKS
jgi:hypothetical protein